MKTRASSKRKTPTTPAPKKKADEKKASATKKAANLPAPHTSPLIRQSLPPIVSNSRLSTPPRHHPGDPPRPPGEDQSPAPSPSVSIAGSCTSASRTGLKLPLQKQLAIDIEGSGGIKAFEGSEQKLSELLNKRETLYGTRGDKLRQQISKKVYRWQLLHRQSEYVETVLNCFSVKSAAIQQKHHQERDNSSLSAASSSSSDESSVDSSTSSDSSGPPHSLPVEESILPTAVEAKKSAPPPPAPIVTKKFISSMSYTKSPRSPSVPLLRDAGKRTSVDLISVLSSCFCFLTHVYFLQR
jgi:hypothetical protein